MAAPAPPTTLPTFEWSTPSAEPTIDDHKDFGRRLGAAYKSMIQTRFASKPDLASAVKTVHTPAGKQLYDSFVALHRRDYPTAMAEIDGIVEGSGLDFEQVFVQNVFEEWSLCAADLPGAPPAKHDVDACSDVMACDTERAGGLCAVAHNEDNGAEDRGALIMVNASFGPSTSWVAATYAGELPSGAFGFSSTGGFGFTLNYVGPKQPACPGAGRVFAARRALDAESYDEALATITGTRMGSGHNYQLVDFGARPSSSSPPRVANVEVAPNGLFAVRAVGAAPFYHTNQYETLRVPEWVGNSSTHRLARMHSLPPPTSTEAMLRLLGDQTDPLGTKGAIWPIFHDAASHARGDGSGWTLCTALFDLSGSFAEGKTLTVYLGNPRLGRVAWRASLLDGRRLPTTKDALIG